MNLIKLMWCRFQQCLGTFTMLLVKRFSQAVLLKHLSGYVFGVRNFEITKSMTITFLWKYSKFDLDSKNAAKNWEKAFCFRDNWIWIDVVKLSPLTTGYFSSAANVLTRSPKIWHVNKTDFFHLKWLRSYPWIIYRWCDPDLNTAWARLPCYLSKVPLKHDFLDIYLTTFSESVISKIQNLWELSFVSKCLKFNLDF